MSEIHPCLVTVPDPNLRKVSMEVSERHQHLEQTVKLMKEVMTACRAHGIGTASIAAPQVGVMLRIFIIWSDAVEIVAINPVITKATGSQVMLEGCLSFPKGVLYALERPNLVKFHYQDLDGKYRAAKFHDLYAAIVMHENDHLNGVLIDDNGMPYSGRN